ncbi:glycosyltransferase family 4 protein [Flavobacterium pectinovorum]|uniref:glycosyltransferase family 4 protein n=1 Tax=Flavobacterium pectinovorum TaxID=29533 RepID=UPI001FAE2F45|nr:glycosyltransferase family 4 protein [Flavobacterium pectinovorum]MCI9843866.1 glycosyltransferase family 4 protein [Flavobacterium pectinovorum]
MKKIVFLLPGHGKKPIGGHKVVYEYANRFFNCGYEVSIIYGASCLFNKMSFYGQCYSILRYFYFKLSKKYFPYKWFDLHKGISIKYTWDLNEKYVEGDVVFATSMETAVSLNTYKKVSNKSKYYLIQDFEYWHWGKEEALKTWYFDFNRIVISQWLKDMGDSLQLNTTLIENGFDFNYFGLDKPIKLRNKFTAIMLYHKLPSKGSKDGLKAFEIVKSKIPELKVILFGTSKKPTDLPNWYVYYQLPDKETLRKIYNEAAMYLGTSHTEGWGLTVGEAMQCGCAVICTDNAGYSIMAKHEKTALVSTIKNYEDLAFNMIRLIENDKLRFEIATNGYENIQKFTWENSFQKIKSLINQNFA